MSASGEFCERHKASTVAARETEQRFHIIPFWRGSCFPLRHFLCAIKILKYAAADKRSREHTEMQPASLHTCALPSESCQTPTCPLKDEHEGVGMNLYTELICVLLQLVRYQMKNDSWAMTSVQEFHSLHWHP
jgi:hypothetical protein